MSDEESLSSILSNEKAPVEAAPVEQKDEKPVVEVVEAKDDTAAPSAAKEEIQGSGQQFRFHRIGNCRDLENIIMDLQKTVFAAKKKGYINTIFQCLLPGKQK